MKRKLFVIASVVALLLSAYTAYAYFTTRGLRIYLMGTRMGAVFAGTWQLTLLAAVLLWIPGAVVLLRKFNKMRRRAASQTSAGQTKTMGGRGTEDSASLIQPQEGNADETELLEPKTGSKDGTELLEPRKDNGDTTELIEPLQNGGDRTELLVREEEKTELLAPASDNSDIPVIAAQKESEPKTPRYCSNCGNLVTGKKFCSRCGTKVSGEVQL